MGHTLSNMGVHNKSKSMHLIVHVCMHCASTNVSCVCTHLHVLIQVVSYSLYVHVHVHVHTCPCPLTQVYTKMRGLAQDGKTPPDGFMAPRYNVHVYTYIEYAASHCTL